MDPGRIPGPVYIPNALAVKLHWNLANNKAATNVLHFRYTSAPSMTEAFVNGVQTDANTAFTSSGVATGIDTETQLLAISVRDLAQDPSGRGFAENRSTGAAVTGGAVGGKPMPYQVAFVVSLKTGFSGQANRGRVYIPGWNTEASDDEGDIQEAHAINAVEFITNFKNAMDGRGLELSIAQPARQAYEGLTGTQHPARAARLTEVTSITRLNLHWDTQRLRAQL
jgi:hypothetical protein